MSPADPSGESPAVPNTLLAQLSELGATGRAMLADFVDLCEAEAHAAIDGVVLGLILAVLIAVFGSCLVFFTAILLGLLLLPEDASGLMVVAFGMVLCLVVTAAAAWRLRRLAHTSFFRLVRQTLRPGTGKGN